VTMRALIVDDEIHSREELESMLKETGEFTVSGKCGNAVEAIRAIRPFGPLFRRMITFPLLSCRLSSQK
jgi:DNA-binding LytR/AlgR family response regulator